VPNRPDQGRRRTKTRSKTRAAVRGLYIGENGKADPSPTFANGASGFGMTTATTENRKQDARSEAEPGHTSGPPAIRRGHTPGQVKKQQASGVNQGLARLVATSHKGTWTKESFLPLECSGLHIMSRP